MSALFIGGPADGHRLDVPPNQSMHTLQWYDKATEQNRDHFYYRFQLDRFCVVYVYGDTEDTVAFNLLMRTYEDRRWHADLFDACLAAIPVTDTNLIDNITSAIARLRSQEDD